MKVCVIKIGARISLDSKSTSGGTGEALSIIKILTEAGIDVDVYTKVLKNDPVSTEFITYDILTQYNQINNRNYDALICVNGNINFFGGQDSPSDTLCYHVINNFSGKVFYVLCDPNILLKDPWDSICKKEWCGNYNEKDIRITRNDIIYISQPRNVKLLKSHIIKKTKIDIADVIHFPFEKFVYLTMKDESPVLNYDYDLIYGGTFRTGKREEDMIKFYFGYPDDIKVQMFGKIKESDFKKNKSNLSLPNFDKAVPYNEFNKKMRTGLSTVIIGDPLYKELDDIAQRTYESVLAGNIVFIDKTYDKKKIVFDNEFLHDFSYVSSRKDVIDRLRKIKDSSNREKLIEKVVKLQKDSVKFNKNEYVNGLKSIIESCLQK